MTLNLLFFPFFFDQEEELILSTDCSFITKSGKHTYGVGCFHNGTVGSPQWGSEISLIACTGVVSGKTLALAVQQTPGKEELALQLSADATRMDWYIQQLKETLPHLPRPLRYVVADGAYAKKKFVDAVAEAGLFTVSKLRCDAELYLPYTGPQKTRGRKRARGEKVDLTAPDQFEYVTTEEDGTEVYSVVAYSPSLKREIRVVYLVFPEGNKRGFIVLFSTDTSLDPLKILAYYRSRFKIEFLFRDAKQFLGLEHCQSRKKERLDYHFNMVFVALNVGRIELYRRYGNHPPPGAGIDSLQREYQLQHTVNVIIDYLDLDPELVKNHPRYADLLAYGSLAA